jgi:hypothetical protein
MTVGHEAVQLGAMSFRRLARIGAAEGHGSLTVESDAPLARSGSVDELGTNGVIWVHGRAASAIAAPIAIRSRSANAYETDTRQLTAHS